MPFIGSSLLWWSGLGVLLLAWSWWGFPQEQPSRKAVFSRLLPLNRASSEKQPLKHMHQHECVCKLIIESDKLATRLWQAGICVGHRLLRKVSSVQLIDTLQQLCCWGLGRLLWFAGELLSDLGLSLKPSEGPQGCWEVSNREMSFIV